jgi:hypothetical protein
MQETYDAIGELWAAARYGEWMYCYERRCRVVNVRRLYHRHQAVLRFQRVVWAPAYAVVGECYSELMGVVLAYSAFEYMRDTVFEIPSPKDVPKARREFYATLDLRPLAPAMQLVAQHYGDGALHGTLASRTRKQLAKALRDDADPYHALLLPEAIRHAFVHGNLTPSTEPLRADDFGPICASFRSGLAELIPAYMWQIVGAGVRRRLAA